MNDPIREIGMVTMMITVARQRPRKKSTTTPTMNNASRMVSSKLLMDTLM